MLPSPPPPPPTPPKYTNQHPPEKSASQQHTSQNPHKILPTGISQHPPDKKAPQQRLSQSHAERMLPSNIKVNVLRLHRENTPQLFKIQYPSEEREKKKTSQQYQSHAEMM